jgi:hypothetical protein
MLNHVHRSKQSQEELKKGVGENKKSVFSLLNIDDDDEDDEDWKAFRERQKMREMKRQNQGLYAECGTFFRTSVLKLGYSLGIYNGAMLF